jgi:hypothetical protein
LFSLNRQTADPTIKEKLFGLAETAMLFADHARRLLTLCCTKIEHLFQNQSGLHLQKYRRHVTDDSQTVGIREILVRFENIGVKLPPKHLGRAALPDALDDALARRGGCGKARRETCDRPGKFKIQHRVDPTHEQKLLS